jgi:hypothetical protein
LFELSKTLSATRAHGGAVLKVNLKIALTMITLALCVSGPVFADEKAERQADAIQVQNLLARRDFAELEKLAEGERDRQLLGSTGIWRLQHFYSYVRTHIRATQHDRGCQAPLPITQFWFSAYPHSPTAIIVNSIAMEETAICFRGEGYANTVSPEAWARFNEQEQAASNFLIAHAQDAKADPQWYAEMEAAAKWENADADAFMNLFQEGTSRFPLYYGIYDKGMIYFAPRWHGSKEDAEKFTKLAAEKTKILIGDDIYARLYWYQSDALYLKNLHNDTAIDWDRISFDSIVHGGPPDHFVRIEPVELSSSDQNALAGDYVSEELIKKYHIESGADGLTLTIGEGQPMALASTGVDRMAIRKIGAELFFQRDSRRRVTGFLINNDRVQGIEFRRVD